MRFPSNRLGRKVVGAATIGLLTLVMGCNGDHDPKGFFDPTATGRWQSHSLVVPILDKLDIGVEQPQSEFSEASDPTPADLVPNDSDYRISPNDMLSITVSDLLGPGVETPRQERVTESGHIMLPSVGEIPATGKTESELEQAIIQAYRDAKLIENAQVSVQVVESREKVFSIYGAIPRPGQYPILNNNFRVLDALVIAGDAPLGSDTLYVIRPIVAQASKANAAATQPATGTPGAIAPAAPAETPFNVLSPTTAPAENLEPPTPSTEGIEPATQPATSDTTVAPFSAPATTKNTEGNVPGGGTTEGMVQMADGTTMPTTMETANTSATTEPAPMAMEATSAPATQPSTMEAAAPATQPGAPEGSVVTLEGQAQPLAAPATQPTTMPGMQLAATATPTTQPSDQNFAFNYPTGSTQYREIRVPLSELKNGDMKYNIVIKAGDYIEIPGPAQGVYYVAGHVNRPGVYQIVGQRVTLKQAIVAAGMFDALGIPERTEIVRRISGNQEVFASVDMDRIFAGEDPDIFVKPNDTINVGTNILAPFLAAIRNGFRITYGFGFIYDKNFNAEAETGVHR